MDILPEPPKDAVVLVHRLNGAIIAGVWVHPDHGGTPSKPFPELVRGAWEFWNSRYEATIGSSGVSPSRPVPRVLELL